MPSDLVRFVAALRLFRLWIAGCALLVPGCATQTPEAATPTGDRPTVAATPTAARAADGRFISWREHRIDDVELGGVAIRGGDGLKIADLDGDGHEDVVSVHEADTTYDGRPGGHVRLAFGSADPDRWELVTLADGEEAGAPEDIALADFDDDGDLDIVVACELAHLIYFENPGADVRGGAWPRIIPETTRGRGSYVRVFAADLDGDGREEVVAPNKGEQNPPNDTPVEHAISAFDVGENALSGAWTEQELARMRIPINSEPVDLDGDGDADVVGGSRGEARVFWLENLGGSPARLIEHPIRIAGSSLTEPPPKPPHLTDHDGPMVTGFNFAFGDLSGYGRLDIVLAEARHYLVWIEQPSEPDAEWTLHTIGQIAPDTMTGFTLADIDGDGDDDVIAGSYSADPRDHDGAERTVDDRLGRIAWFEQPADPTAGWLRHDIVRRKRGMFDQFVARDLDLDGDFDFVGTRGNSADFDGVFWLEQVRSTAPIASFAQARSIDSEHMRLPSN